MLAYVFICFTAFYTFWLKAIKRAMIIFYGEYQQIWKKKIYKFIKTSIQEIRFIFRVDVGGKNSVNYNLVLENW
jgi:hypothetical protein